MNRRGPPRHCSHALGPALALASLACAVSADAQERIAPPALWSGPVFAADAPLRVTRESLTVRCRGDGAKATCDFDAHYALVNPGTEAYRGLVGFYGVRASRVVLAIDGRAAPPPPRGLSALDAVANVASGDGHLSRIDDVMRRNGVMIEVPAGREVTLTVTGQLEVEPASTDELPLTIPALSARHPLLATGDPHDYTHALEYLVSPIASWSPAHRLEIRLRHPASWKNDGFAGELSALDANGAAETTSRTPEGDVERVLVLEGPTGPGATGGEVSFQAELPESILHNGGPYAALGGAFGQANVSGVRARFGYEIAAPAGVFESVSVDVDFRGRVALTPAVEAATPQLFVLPSLSLGVGVPIQLVPVATPGIRVEGGLQIFMLGLVGSVDVFPGLASEQGRVQGALLGRVSL